MWSSWCLYRRVSGMACLRMRKAGCVRPPLSHACMCACLCACVPVQRYHHPLCNVLVTHIINVSDKCFYLPMVRTVYMCPTPSLYAKHMPVYVPIPTPDCMQSVCQCMCPSLRPTVCKAYASVCTHPYTRLLSVHPSLFAYMAPTNEETCTL